MTRLVTSSPARLSSTMGTTGRTPGVYVRTAVDRHTLDRENTARLFRNSLNVPSQREHLRSGAAEASTGDVVFVCCLASDRLDWVIGQLAGTDSLQVCVSVAGDMLWWTTLAAPNSTYSEEESETLGEAGLTGDAATIADLIRSESQRHKSARQKAAAAQRADHGWAPRGVRPTGYTVTGELVPEEASWPSHQALITGTRPKGRRRTGPAMCVTHGHHYRRWACGRLARSERAPRLGRSPFGVDMRPNGCSRRDCRNSETSRPTRTAYIHLTG